MNLRRPEFEKAYAESHDIPVEEIEKYRMAETYRLPMIAKCWRFWQMALQVGLSPAEHARDAFSCFVCGAIGAHGGLPCPQMKPMSNAGLPAGERS